MWRPVARSAKGWNGHARPRLVQHVWARQERVMRAKHKKSLPNV